MAVNQWIEREMTWAHYAHEWGDKTDAIERMTDIILEVLEGVPYAEVLENRRKKEAAKKEERMYRMGFYD